MKRKDLVGMQLKNVCKREEYEEVAKSVEHFATGILAQCRNSKEVEFIFAVVKDVI